MARQKGSLSLSSNLEPRMASSLDARYIVEHDADLTDSNSWEYVYTGMQVYSRESQKVYILRYDNPTVSSSWVEIGTGKDGLDGKPIMLENTEKIGRENIITLVWTDIHGADHSTDITILDGAVGPQGPEGRQGPAGQSFSLHSQYDSYEELIAEHPTGSDGEAYFVTSETEGAAPDVYVWLTDTEEWYNQGPITGIAGPQGEDGFSPDITVAETSDGSYKLRITTSNGSFVTPNLQGNLAPQDIIDTSANPVQSGTIKTALDAKQDKTLAVAVGVRDYTDGVVKDQSTVQTTLEALAAAVNYMNIPAQLISKVDTVEELPANAKPGSICFVGEEGETPVVYICQDDETWQKAGGTSDDNLVEFTSNEIDAIWNAASEVAAWISGTALPQDFGSFGACVYDGRINILGGYAFREDVRNNNNYHYRLNNGVWESVSTMPSGFSVDNSYNICGQAISYDNKIFVISGTKMKIWDGSEWTLGNLPYEFYGGGVVIYDNKIHILGGTGGSRKHYSWNGTEWASESDLPISFTSGASIVYNNKIHIISNVGGNNHYTWNGSAWTQELDTYPTGFSALFAVEYDEKISVFGSSSRFEYNSSNNTWIKKEDVNMHIGINSRGVVLNGHIHVMGGQQINNVGSPRGHIVL